MTPPGVSGPRTQLAWDRTALSAAALGAVSVKLGISHDIVVEIIAGALSLVMATTLALAVRQRASPHDERHATVISARATRAVAALATVTGGLIAVTMVIAAHP